MDSMVRFCLTLSALVSDHVAAARRDERGHGILKDVRRARHDHRPGAPARDSGDTSHEESISRSREILDTEQHEQARPGRDLTVRVSGTRPPRGQIL